MPDETREALERALYRFNDDGADRQIRGKLADAIDARIDARVRALATGADGVPLGPVPESWHTPEAALYVKNQPSAEALAMQRAAGGSFRHDGGGERACSGPLTESSGRDEAHAQAVESQPIVEVRRCPDGSARLFVNGCGCASWPWHRDTAEPDDYARSVADCIRAALRRHGQKGREDWPLITSAAPRARTGGEETKEESDGEAPQGSVSGHGHDVSEGVPGAERRQSRAVVPWVREVPAQVAGGDRGGDRRVEVAPPSPEREGQDPFVHWDREQRELAAAERIAEERRERAKQAESDLSRFKVALANVSGALCDAGGVVPGDETRYGEAVRKLTADRDEAYGTARRNDERVRRLVDGGKFQRVRDDSQCKRIAELEGALLRARTSLVIMRCGAKGRIADGLDMSVTDIDAALHAHRKETR